LGKIEQVQLAIVHLRNHFVDEQECTIDISHNMASYNTIEPTVIEEDLLRKSVNEQATGDAAEIARKEGIDPTEVVCLRLDYKSKLRR
jgi:hypothetical protein